MIDMPQWDVVPIDAYDDANAGEAAPMPAAPGETVTPPRDPEPVQARTPRPASGPRPESMIQMYKRLKDQGCNSNYAAEMAVRHMKETRNAEAYDR